MKIEFTSSATCVLSTFHQKLFTCRTIVNQLSSIDFDAATKKAPTCKQHIDL